MLRSFIDQNGNIQYFPNYNLDIPTTTLNYVPLSPFGLPQPFLNPMYTPTKEIYTPSYTLYPRPDVFPIGFVSSSRNISDVNNDPELRKKITKYIYEKYKTVWLPFSFIKLQRYLINKDDVITVIKNINEYEQTTSNDNTKINYILDTIFGKHELLVFLDKFISANNANWYDLKSKFLDQIKYDLYNKIKNHMKKIVLNKL